MPPSEVFAERDGAIVCEGVSLEALADEVGSPTWVYSASRIDAAYGAIADAMRGATDRPVLVAYAIKANGNLAILRRLAALGCGADIVSGGELARALHAGIPAERIVFSGVGKRRDEIAYALRERIRAIHVESEAELHVVAEEAAKLGVKAPVALRVNPNVDAGTHPYIATGLHDTKFGLELDRAREVLPFALQSPHLVLHGVSCHIGSQLDSPAPLEEAVTLLGRFANECREAGAPLVSIDVGGGWPLAYGHESRPYPPASAFAQAIRRGLEASETTDLEVVTEPGRALVADAAILLTRVLYVKYQGGKRFVIVDGGITELIRPALYGAFHAIAPVRPREGARTPADVVGPICESGDFFAHGRLLPPVEVGDLVAIFGAGAYGREMSSTYNARPLAAEVLVEGDAWRVVRRRQTIEELWRLEE
ncbi:MAG: diaminopimelate decarboxylase [Sandaracinus sp.]|nr:diaminopimelate decarboxylase [Sandaracinus sp.]